MQFLKHFALPSLLFAFDSTVHITPYIYIYITIFSCIYVYLSFSASYISTRTYISLPHPTKTSFRTFEKKGASEGTFEMVLLLCLLHWFCKHALLFASHTQSLSAMLLVKWQIPVISSTRFCSFSVLVFAHFFFHPSNVFTPLFCFYPLAWFNTEWTNNKPKRDIWSVLT